MTTTTAPPRPKPPRTTTPVRRPSRVAAAGRLGVKAAKALAARNARRRSERGTFERAVHAKLFEWGHDQRPTREQRAQAIRAVRVGKSAASQVYWDRRSRLSSRMGRGLGRGVVGAGRGVGWLSVRGYRGGRRASVWTWNSTRGARARVAGRGHGLASWLYARELRTARAKAHGTHVPARQRVAGYARPRVQRALYRPLPGGGRHPRWRRGYREAWLGPKRPTDAPAPKPPAPPPDARSGPVIPVRPSTVPTPSTNPSPGGTPMAGSTSTLSPTSEFGDREPDKAADIEEMAADMAALAEDFARRVEAHLTSVSSGTAAMRGRKLDPAVTQHLRSVAEGLTQAQTGARAYAQAFDDVYGPAMREAKREETQHTDFLTGERS